MDTPLKQKLNQLTLSFALNLQKYFFYLDKSIYYQHFNVNLSSISYLILLKLVLNFFVLHQKISMRLINYYQHLKLQHF